MSVSFFFLNLRPFVDFGGMMSYVAGCEKSDVFRAIAPMFGSMMGGCSISDAAPAADFGAHGDADDFVTNQSGRDARDIYVARNHCSEQTRVVESPYPDYYIAYDGCDEGYTGVNSAAHT